MAREFGLEESFLERLMDRPLYSREHGRGRSFVKLVKNYRSHQAILRYPNDKFYDGKLEVCSSASTINMFMRLPQLVSPEFPVVFPAISGQNEHEASSPSWFNKEEVLQVKAYIVALLRDRQFPYRKTLGSSRHTMRKKIRQLLQLAKLADVKVGSVEEFQGQERNVIVVSIVRSSRDMLAYDTKFALGFLSNARLFNVAMTRVKAPFIVVGDVPILSVDLLWRAFMNCVHTNNGWRGDAPTWDVNAAVLEGADYVDKLREAIAADMNAVMAQLPPEEDMKVEVNVDREAPEDEAGRAGCQWCSFSPNTILAHESLVRRLVVAATPSLTTEVMSKLGHVLARFSRAGRFAQSIPSQYILFPFNGEKPTLVPNGVLLYGTLGTGKTLLACPAAYHTDCKFIRISSSKLMQKYIGKGSRTVRDLFVMARKHTPSIIFIDEIDEIGSSSGESGWGGGDSEVQRTMLELLNQLDGFESTKNIKVIMVTNRIDILDWALLRPGGIDRKIEFPPPGLRCGLQSCVSTRGRCRCSRA
ncbi:transporter [Ganoderma sinense ZZ0214-1]|uniref:Transporter n=1 Tax=Ganoderma sinense ZZ0214-1 TaxID=1077348 RepID=A0A2G8S682_9APHY|nr:transporter [Ganoderma sinense ZZ0214-1]